MKHQAQRRPDKINIVLQNMVSVGMTFLDIFFQMSLIRIVSSLELYDDKELIKNITNSNS